MILAVLNATRMLNVKEYQENCNSKGVCPVWYTPFLKWLPPRGKLSVAQTTD